MVLRPNPPVQHRVDLLDGLGDELNIREPLRVRVQADAQMLNEVTGWQHGPGELHLGDAIASVTKFLGMVPCGDCQRRRKWLNKFRIPAFVGQLIQGLGKGD